MADKEIKQKFRHLNKELTKTEKEILQIDKRQDRKLDRLEKKVRRL